MSFSAVAFMCVYNEADIIPWTIPHLISQGVNVHIIDNWSTDGSDVIAKGFPIAGYERWPESGPSQYYEWAALLRRVECLAEKSTADWCSLNDADEIRRSPWTGVTLCDGFRRVQEEGYNAVNHQVYHFPPTDNTYTGDPERHFRFYTLEHHDAKMTRNVKSWRNLGQRPTLGLTGGHYAGFDGIKIYPTRFILKHYPMRSSEHAERKVLRERMARYSPQERAQAWHIQYNGISQTRSWLADPKGLTEWNDSLLLPA